MTERKIVIEWIMLGKISRNKLKQCSIGAQLCIMTWGWNSEEEEKDLKRRKGG